MGLKRAVVIVAGLAITIASAPLPASAVVNGHQVTQQTGAVSLEIRRTFGIQHACSGVLISPTWVLTARHCAGGYAFSGVRAGSLSRSSAQVYGVSRQLISPAGDLGLVQLSSPAASVILPWSAQQPQLGATIETQGFGRTSASGDYSNTLKGVTGKVTGFPKDNRYGNLTVAWNSSEGQTANADSGGPAIINGQVVGAHLGLIGSSMAFTPLSLVTDWITQTTGVAPSSGSMAQQTSAPKPQITQGPTLAPSADPGAADSPDGMGDTDPDGVVDSSPSPTTSANAPTPRPSLPRPSSPAAQPGSGAEELEPSMAPSTAIGDPPTLPATRPTAPRPSAPAASATDGWAKFVGFFQRIGDWFRSWGLR